jgi:hypothetical protein
VLLDPGLDEEGALLRREADTQPIEQDLVGEASDAAGALVVAGQGVPVRDEKEALVFILQAHPVGEGAVVVSQVQRPRGPHAAQQPFFHKNACAPVV